MTDDVVVYEQGDPATPTLDERRQDQCYVTAGLLLWLEASAEDDDE